MAAWDRGADAAPLRQHVRVLGVGRADHGESLASRARCVWARDDPSGPGVDPLRGCPAVLESPKRVGARGGSKARLPAHRGTRSEEHTSELQSLAYLVCRLLLEKKK